jgi:hypothetical protein
VAGSWVRLFQRPGRPDLGERHPSLALYRRVDSATFEARTIQLIEVPDGLITRIHSFVEPRLFPLFDLPTRVIEQHAVQPDE